jgi:serine/threonine protein kinase
MSSCTLIDQLLNDRYKIIRPLGTGGMGQTYLAEDTRRPGNPQCVVKQLKPASTDPKFLVTAKRLFDNEAVILEKLGRTNDQIPQLLERFEKDGEFYLVQDFVDGEPLTSEMPLGQRWSETQVIQLLQEVLPILDAVHNAGIIHRDVKPDNLIRRQDGKLCLIDFGAVKQIRTYQPAHSQLISLTVAIGTPGYMPTEQSKGKPRPNSDLYALGMVAIQALTGMLPSQLREDDNGEVIWRDQAEVNEGLATVLDKMVRYHFKERFETATEALQALHELTAAKSTQTTSNSQQSAKGAYQPTVEAEPIRNNPGQKPDSAAQSETWEEPEVTAALMPTHDSAKEGAHKAAPAPRQGATESPNAISKREWLLLEMVITHLCLLLL